MFCYNNYSVHMLFYIQQDIMKILEIASKPAINKLLIPISLKNSIEQLMKRPYTSEIYPEVS